VSMPAFDDRALVRLSRERSDRMLPAGPAAAQILKGRVLAAFDDNACFTEFVFIAHCHFFCFSGPPSNNFAHL
jgi:hypothetical protein